jgi:hypothetical protein
MSANKNKPLRNYDNEELDDYIKKRKRLQEQEDYRENKWKHKKERKSFKDLNFD